MRVNQAMTSEVITVPVGMPVPEAAALLVRARISGAPVVDGARRVVGVLSESDLVRALADGQRNGLLGFQRAVPGGARRPRGT